MFGLKFTRLGRTSYPQEPRAVGDEASEVVILYSEDLTLTKRQLGITPSPTKLTTSYY